MTLSAPFAASTRSHVLLALVGVAALVWWASWWARNLGQNKLQRSPPSWFARVDFLGLDFLHNYHAARHWLAGGDPFREPFGDPLGRKLCYPPAVLPFFAWCGVLPPKTAVVVWTIALAAIAGAGTVAAWRARNSLGLAPVPLPFALAAVLTSGPIAYAMERGNYDLLILPLVMGAAWAMRERTLGRDAVAGVCLALATCFKIYPVLLILALIPMRRWRAIAFALAAGAAAAGFQSHNLPIFVANLKELAVFHNTVFWGGYPLAANHSLTCNWEALWGGTKLAFLAKVPGPVAAAAVLGPLLAWVGYRVYWCPDSRRVALPYLLFVAAAATFVPKVANDYSLFFLPLAALSVWDRRDPVAVHIGLGFMLLWAQPIGFPVAPSLMLGLKLAALFACAAALVNRIWEQTHPLPRVGFVGPVGES